MQNCGITLSELKLNPFLLVVCDWNKFSNMLCECAKDELVSLTASQQIFQQKMEMSPVQYVLLNSMYILI
jgi:hypothetical protein